jgi:heme/copper-type cytochrome/quinol oxidase subunit 3
VAERIVARPEGLELGPIRSRGIGWNGMAMLIASEAALFVYLLFSYYYLAASFPPGWVLEPRPSLTLALPNTVLLLASSVAAWWGEEGMKKDDRRQALAGLAAAFAMGVAFAVVQGFEWHAKTFPIGANGYASLYYVTTGFHMAHVIAGLVILAALLAWAWRDYFSPVRALPLSNGVIYWHFVDAVWLAVFFTYYLSPYAGVGT